MGDNEGNREIDEQAFSVIQEKKLVMMEIQRNGQILSLFEIEIMMGEKDSNSKRYMHLSVHSCTIYNSQDMKTT